MFKDAQKELRRLEEELLAQDEDEQEEEEFDEEFQDDWDDEPEDENADDFAEFDQDTWENPHASLVFRSGAEKFRQQLAAKQNESRIYNADPRDMEPEDLDDEDNGSGGSLRGLVIFAALLALGVVGMVVWFLLRFGG